MPICIFLIIFTLPIICSTSENFYVINSLPTPNLTCYRHNEQFQPCGTLEILLNFSQNVGRIYLLDSQIKISRNIHLQFLSQHKVMIKAWRNNLFSTVICNNSDFSMAFNGIKNEVVVQSIQFSNCAKSRPLLLIHAEQWPVKLVVILNVTFLYSGQSSLVIGSDIQELKIINSTFTGGQKGVDINTGTVFKAILTNTTFSHNKIGSLISHGYLNKSSLDMQNFIFSNNVGTDFSILLYSFHSIVIISSYFERNFADNFVRVENAINISIEDTFFNGNVVQKGSVLHLRSGVSIVSYFFFGKNTVSNKRT